jgi:curved DNA-binding protein CbpA
MVKKIEDLDYYEVLGLPFDASERDIRNGYILAVAAYHEDALASYGVLGAAERRAMLDRIEEAFQTLANAEARQSYDALILPSRPEFQSRAYFRNSTEKLKIEDAEHEEKLWDRLKSLVLPSRHRKSDEEDGVDVHSSKDWKALLKSHYYYGAYLKLIREKRGLTLDDTARSCRTSLDRLRALEEEDYERFSSGKEISRLLRRYARCLGLDSANGD